MMSWTTTLAILSCVQVRAGSLSWYSDCSTARDDMRSAALLYAHRCNLRDVPVQVPAPINIIPDLILPSHVVVPRCQGKIFEYLNIFRSR